MEKKGMSTGCIVGLVIGGFFVVAAVIMVAVFGFGLLYYRSGQGVSTVNETPVTGTAPGASSPASSGAAARPDPTPEQARAVEGGQSITWADQGMSWTVPAGWNKQQETKEIFSVKSPGSWDAGWLTVSISPMPADFPTDMSIDAMYKGALDKQQLGDYTMVRWLELDGIKGVQFVEAPPEDSSDVRRVQWQGYRKYNGQSQLINLMVHSSGKGFPTHENELYGILYTSKVSK
jgi:hypothetical protein